MVRIDDPIVVGDTLFLRTDDPDLVVRLPSAPDVLRPIGGTPAAALELFRGDPNELDVDLGPVMTQGGVISLTLDLGALDAGRAAREAELPSDGPARVSHAPLTGGIVRLFFEDALAGEAQIPATRRPIIAVSLVVDPIPATLTRSVIEDGRPGPLSVAVEGAIAVQRDGISTRLRIDFEQVARILTPGEAVTAVGAAAAIDELLQGGAVSIERMASIPLRDFDLLDWAAVANAIFEPVAGEASSFIPGIVLDGYTPSGSVRPRAGRGVVNFQLDGSNVALPWFASGVLDMTGALIRLSELPEPPLDLVVLQPNIAMPAGIDAIAVEVEMHGSTRGVRLGPDHRPVTLRFVRPAGAAPSYRWRTGHVAGGDTAWGGWWTTEDRYLIVDADLRPAAETEAS